MRLRYFLILFICLVLTGCSININLNNNSDNPISTNEISNDIKKFRKEYNELNSYIEVNIPDDTYIHYATSKEVLDILTTGTGIIYFGRPTCPWCRNIIPVLAEVAVKNNMIINYYNPGEVSLNDIDIYMQIKDKISSYLRKDENGDPAIYLPDVYFVINGSVVGHKLGSSSTQDDPYTPLTNLQRQELIDIYTNYIKELK